VTIPVPSLVVDRVAEGEGRANLTGVQALARLPLDVRRPDRRAGRSKAVFMSGYEGSPLAVTRHLPGGGRNTPQVLQEITAEFE